MMLHPRLLHLCWLIAWCQSRVLSTQKLHQYTFIDYSSRFYEHNASVQIRHRAEVELTFLSLDCRMQARQSKNRVAYLCPIK